MPPYGAFRKIGADRTLLWIGVNLASCVTAAGTAEPFTLSLEGRKIFPSRSAYPWNGMYFYTFLHFFFTFLSVSGILYERLKG